MSVDCLYCKNHLSTLASRDQVSPFCGEWEPKTLTVFDQITQSPEVLAAEMVFWGHDKDGEWYTSHLLDEDYRIEAEAIAATVEKLKEVCHE